MLLTGGIDGQIILWDLVKESCKTLQDSGKYICATAFSLDADLGFAASTDHAVHVWNIETGRRCDGFIGHNDWVSSIAFLP
jgi:WD40 repeat protein